MKSYYLEKIGIEKKDIAQNWGNKNDKCQKHWKKQRKKYGFDETETWSLDVAFLQWLYTRLKMYDEINCIDTSGDNCHRYIYKDQEVTFQWCIDRLIELLEYVLIHDKWKTDNEEKYSASISEIFDIFKLCFHSLWW